jgi:peptidoglycan hydrolase CwlO-like protein
VVIRVSELKEVKEEVKELREDLESYRKQIETLRNYIRHLERKNDLLQRDMRGGQIPPHQRFIV